MAGPGMSMWHVRQRPTSLLQLSAVCPISMQRRHPRP